MLEVLMVTMMRWSDHHGSNPAVCFSWSDFNDFLMCEIRSLSYCTPTLKWAIFHSFTHGSSHCLKMALKWSHFYPYFDAFYPHFDAFNPLFWCILSSFLTLFNSELVHFTLIFDEFYQFYSWFDAFDCLTFISIQFNSISIHFIFVFTFFSLPKKHDTFWEIFKHHETF